METHLIFNNPVTHCPVCGKPWEGGEAVICPRNHDFEVLLQAWRRVGDEALVRLEAENRAKEEYLEALRDSLRGGK